ncbi:MAG: 5'-nucleotidase C-terminal domain-containing protein [Myxococcales bacterium]|nr:5'-nucleotidase C-terminal domain-containing protein [Myxococcales bacterium]
MALCFGAFGVGCQTSPGESVNLQGDVRFTLLHTADWHSRLLPYNQQVNQTDLALGLRPENAPFGGAARMNYLIQRERSRADRILHLDSGDCFQGAPIFNFFNGEAEVRALAHTGVDAVVVGNHEFDRGALNFARQYQRWGTFETLAANYQFDDPTTPGSSELGRVVKPYAFFNLRGLKVGVIGLGNLSSITSIFDQPNRLGIIPLNTIEVTQHYIDLVREQGADVIVLVSHIGLEDDIHTLEFSTGADIVLGGHLHIVLNPTQEVEDCRPFDRQGNHFIPVLEETRASPRPPATCGATECCAPSGACAPSGQFPYWRLASGYRARACRPRRVILQHSGAFMKYLGRLDTVLSNNPARIYPGHEADYDPRNRWEVVSHRFSLFPVDSTVPEEPTMKRMLEPYARALDTVANLDALVGYAPADITRTPAGGGDSALGNLVSTSMWLRLGIQTDFSLTNTLGIRDNIPAGPVSLDQIFNVFPFDNSITTMILSGREVQELFDFVARRSAGRGCNSQAQIAGARVVIVCGSCDRRDAQGQPLTACAETINIGLRTDPAATQRPCETAEDCNPGGVAATPPSSRSLCDPNAHRCMTPLSLNASYAAAVNNYIAGGGSGFFVLQRNTTQTDTRVEQRDAVIDFVRTAPPCGYSVDVTVERNRRRGITDAAELRVPQHPDDGLRDCRTDDDCGAESLCACAERITFDDTRRMCVTAPSCAAGEGRCVLRQCRDDMRELVVRSCPAQPNDLATARCQCTAEIRAAMSCRILSCIDENTGARQDGRLNMVSR